MKFELFGRFKDENDDNANAAEADQSFQQNLGQDSQEETNFGSAIETTIENMFDQGYSEDEIRQELKGQYSDQEINQAINRIVRDSATSTGPQGSPEPMTPYQEEQDGAVSPMDEGYDEGPDDQQGDDLQMPPQNNNPTQEQQDFMQQNPPQNNAPQRQAQGPKQAPDASSEEVEELIETIISEKFELVEKEFENVYEELDTFAEEIEELKQRVHDLEVRDDEDQREFIEKIDEVEEHIDRYDSRIGGLEKAFQQVLPSLVDNVRDLTNLVQELKQEKGVETDTNVSEEDIKDLDWQ